MDKFIVNFIAIARPVITFKTILLFLLIPAISDAQAIDRFKLVNRHNVFVYKMDPLSPLSVGNGDFAYTADVTGMQSFENYYHANGIPLETLSTWAWHSFPNPKNLKLADAMKEIDFHGRKILYTSQEKTAAGEYYRQNPHPVPLGQISLAQGDGKPLALTDFANIDQKLDLWKGIIYSHYTLHGVPVWVETMAHSNRSAVAFKIKSALLKAGKLKQVFRFPYAYNLSIKNKPPFDWTKPRLHQSIVVDRTTKHALLKRIIGQTQYFINISWSGHANLRQDSLHRFTLDATGADSLTLVCEFLQAPNTASALSFEGVKEASESSWEKYWTKGGAVDLSGSKDARANELERRMVLSQYLMKVNYAGAFPPQESGLTHISWYGKHNSEVYWWHAAQFYQWGRPELLAKSFAWYKKILPKAMAEAKREGFEGARWPKMAGVDGRTSPGSINPFIIWNQPNPIYLAELLYRANPNKATLQQWSNVVFESAKFLSSYAYYDTKTNRYILGPPIKSVNEHTEENNTRNPTFELAQWYYSLKVAQDWRLRMGLARNKKWDDILAKLARPAVNQGKYVEIETDPDMYNRKGHVSSDMIMALGYLPQTPMVQPQIMKETFKTIYQRNGLNSFISWSLGKGAMTAARIGDKHKAVDIVCNDLMGAHFLPNGHVQRAKEPLACPAYLPANSAFLAATALMAAGWDGAPSGNAPGFPQNGEWKVKVEGLNKLP
jgi:hypothetical protein